MKDAMLHVANYFFYIFHTLLILFNLFGWIFPKMRRLNLLTLIITFASWGSIRFMERLGILFFNGLALRHFAKIR